MTPIYDWKKEIKSKELNNVIDILKSNGLVIVPTETVYGLAANGFSNEACSKIFTAKGRAQDNPLIIHVSDVEMIDKITEPRSAIEQKLIESFMPGPFTLILKKKKVICDIATCGGDSVGIRMPSNPIMHEIISKSGIAIAAPSANISGRPSGTNIGDIYEEFKDRVDAFIDGGECNIGIESTVVKVIDGIPTILRPGFVTEDDIKKVCGKVKLSDKLFSTVSPEEKVESPGMKYRHYAPKTKCELVEFGEDQIDKIKTILSKNKDKRICVMGFSEDKNKFDIAPELFIDFGSKNNLNEISKNIFTDLRKIDKLNCDIAIIEGLEKKNLGLSIMNRLVRACENNII
jgi:L-threonylcarbamoyladenylate synthase